MSQSYNPKEIEKKWQKVWEEEKAFQATDDYSKPKYYALVEFPYPSGQGLHVGHPRPYTALDIVARKRRMQGYNVLFPIGFDAYGLPTENYAIKTKTHPRIITDKITPKYSHNLLLYPSKYTAVNELIIRNIDGNLSYLKNKTIIESLPPILKKIKNDVFKFRI